MHNPLAAYRVTQTWAQHRAAGLVGGIDYATPYGTPLVAPAAGRLSFIGGTVTVKLADGSRQVYMHCSAPIGRNNRNVLEGEQIAKSGGTSAGPHTHAHGITAAGIRIPPFAGSTTPAGGTTIMATAAEIWRSVFVNRGGKKVSVLQELADTKSNTINILARLDKLNAPTTATLTPAQLDTLATAVAAKITVPTKGTITLTQ